MLPGTLDYNSVHHKRPSKNRGTIKYTRKFYEKVAFKGNTLYNRSVRNGNEIVVARVMPYPLDEHGGVVTNALGSVEPLRREEIIVYPSAPRKWWRRGTSPRTPYFGSSLFKTPRQNTRTDYTVTSSAAAKTFHHRQDWDIIHVDEPTAHLAPPTMFGPLTQLILQAPRREDGKTRAIFGATFHSRLDHPSRRNKMERAAMKLYPLFKTSWGVPYRYRGQLLPTLEETFGSRLLAVSQGTASFWNEIYPGKYEVLYNGFDTKKYIPEGEKMDSWRKDGKKIIFMAGRHDPRKRFDLGIEIFARLRNYRDDIKLVIAGKGQETSKLKWLARSLQLPAEDIEFVGFLDERDLPKAYRTGDIFMAPSDGGEGFGRVLAESMACGTPVVTFDIDGYREATNNQPFTQAVPLYDIDAFVLALGEFLDISQETKTTWEHEAWQYIDRNFGWTIIARKQADIYRRWIDEYDRPPVNDKNHKIAA